MSAPDWLMALKEGDMFETPGLMPGLDDQEPVVFQVLEVEQGPRASGDELIRRITVHAYYHDVFLATGKAGVYIGQEKPLWSFK